MIFEYIEELDRVLPVIDEGDPSPSDADAQEAERLEAAVLARDPRAVLAPADEFGNVAVFWRGER